jgi:hypothetical protein
MSIDSYSKGNRFEFRLDTGYPMTELCVYSLVPPANSRVEPQEHFLPNPFQFVIVILSYHLTLHFSY